MFVIVLCDSTVYFGDTKTPHPLSIIQKSFLVYNCIQFCRHALFGNIVNIIAYLANLRVCEGY